jgi:hypothetical protein
MVFTVWAFCNFCQTDELFVCSFIHLHPQACWLYNKIVLCIFDGLGSVVHFPSGCVAKINIIGPVTVTVTQWLWWFRNVTLWFTPICLVILLKDYSSIHGKGLVVHIPSGCVAKINIPWPSPSPWSFLWIYWNSSFFSECGKCAWAPDNFRMKHSGLKWNHSW